MSEKKNKMVQPRNGVIERAYHPPKQENPPKNPPKGGIPISTPNKPQKPKK